jgi:hypothetical protein
LAGDWTKSNSPAKIVIHQQKGKQMTLGGYTYQVGDLFTTSKTGITGRIEKFVPQSRNVTKVMLRLANGQQRFAMVKTI